MLFILSLIRRGRESSSPRVSYPADHQSVTIVHHPIVVFKTRLQPVTKYTERYEGSTSVVIGDVQLLMRLTAPELSTVRSMTSYI